MVTSAWVAWACLSALVSPSWTIRYAERSIARGSGSRSPSTCSRTGSPARLTSSTSESSASRPGWGPSSTSSPSRRIAPSEGGGRLSLALRERGAHLRRFSLSLGEARAHLRRLCLQGTFAQGVAGDPGDDEPEGDEDEDAGRLRAGDVGDHDRDPSEHDREADSRLPLVAEVSEQERGC